MKASGWDFAATCSKRQDVTRAQSLQECLLIVG